MKRLLILILITLLGLSFAYAQPAQPEPQLSSEPKQQEVKKEEKKDDKPEVKIEFTVFSGYLYNPSTVQNNSTNFNSFYLNRAFVDFKVDFKNGIRLRVTPDVNPTTSGWILRLRHAFVDVSVIRDLLLVSGGITRTEWIGYVDEFVGMRYITLSPADRFRLRSSVDIGVSLTLTPMKGFEVFAGIFDGNGFSRGSDDVQTIQVVTNFRIVGNNLVMTVTTNQLNYINVSKEIGTRVVIAPVYLLTGDTNFLNMVVALHTYNTILTPDMTNASGTELYGIGIGINYSPIRVFSEYSVYTTILQNVSSTHGNYFGILGKLNFGFVGLKEVSLVGAYYLLEPNVAIQDDERSYYLGGIEYTLNRNFSISLNAKIDQRKEGYRDFNNNKVDHQTTINVDTLIRL
ncbi:MAG: hypothetical protein ABDH28_00855 [Brevinematia bacterium]